MSIIERSCTTADLDRVFDLLGRCRRAGYVDMEPLSTNLRLIVADTDFDHRWSLLLEDHERLISFALLWQGQYLGMLIDPGWRGRLEPQVLAWAERHMAGAGQHSRLIVLSRDDDRLMMSFLNERGFVLDDDELRMERSLNDPLPMATTSPGFVIRPLQGAAELQDWLDLYSEAFGPRAAKLRHWRAMRDDPDHNPALDLVAMSAAGQLAGMCYCSIASFEASNDAVVEGRTEPIAVSRNFQRRGIGQALVSAGLTALREHGADLATLTTETDNVVAHRFYSSLGYRERYRAHWYGRNLLVD